MNIFYLDRDPVLAAQMQCDKHVVKMILESAQLLCTAHRILDGDGAGADAIGLYKIAHKNHPSAIWARDRQANYNWLFTHMKALMAEYTYRYDGKHHKSEFLLEYIESCPMSLMTCKLPFTPPPQCGMSDKYKSDDAVLAYQLYYVFEKTSMCNGTGPQWGKTREAPNWYKEKVYA
jgi:hypothetical protein